MADKVNRSPNENIFVRHLVGTDQGKTDTIRKWFEQHFKVPTDDIVDAFS